MSACPPLNLRMKSAVAFAGPIPLQGAGFSVRHNGQTDVCQPRSRRKPRRASTVVALHSDNPDVAVIGGGAAGLSTALRIALSGASVSVYSKAPDASAIRASAGMLVPHCETFASSALEKLAHASHGKYPDYIHMLERLTGAELGYVSRGDVLYMLQDGEVAPESVVRNGKFIRREALLAMETSLGPSISSAYQMPGGAYIDNRSLYAALEKACRVLGVNIELGAEVASIRASPSGAKVDHILLASGEVVRAGHYVGATGSWLKNLFPNIPVRPVKGQMLCLEPRGSVSKALEGTPTLQHLLYSHDCYIVPRQGGRRYFVGATVEEAGFDRETTASGISSLLSKAIQAVPAFADYRLADSWAGLRPATPDLCPILGLSEYSNLSFASGYYRNGVLLMPAAAEIAAAVALGETGLLAPELRDALDEFSYERFSSSTERSAEGSTEGSVTRSAASANINSIYQGTRKVSNSANPGGGAGDDEEVLLYYVRPDGSREPVRRGEVPSVFRQGSGDVQGEEEAIREEAARKGWSVNGASSGLEFAANGTANRKGEADETSAVNDAYDDILLKEDKSNVRSSSLAANRSFGVKTLPGREGSCLSAEETQFLDSAFEEGQRAGKAVSFEVFGPEGEVQLLPKDRKISADGINGLSGAP